MVWTPWSSKGSKNDNPVPAETDGGGGEASSAVDMLFENSALVKSDPAEELLAQEKETMNRLAMEREVPKEKYYRDMYVNLMRQHQGLLKGDALFEEERGTIQKLLQSQRQSVISGFVVGIVCFITLRHLPRAGVRYLGGEEKLRAIDAADAAAKAEGRLWIQQVTQFGVESLISAWVAHRTYLAVSNNTLSGEEALDSLSKLPLSKGRTAVAETLCRDWRDITERQIPQSFWKNLDAVDQVYHDDRAPTSGLQDPKTFQAIRDFALNCKRREIYEAMLRKEYGDNGGSGDEPLSFPNAVPEFDVVQAEKLTLGQGET